MGVRGDHLWESSIIAWIHLPRREFGFNQPCMCHSGNARSLANAITSRCLSLYIKRHLIMWHSCRQGPVPARLQPPSWKTRLPRYQEKGPHNFPKVLAWFILCRAFRKIWLSRRIFARPEQHRRLKLPRTFPTRCRRPYACDMWTSLGHA